MKCIGPIYSDLHACMAANLHHELEISVDEQTLRVRCAMVR